MNKSIDIIRNACYNIYTVKREHPERKEDRKVSKKKKNDNQNKTLAVIVLITAILNLLKSIAELIEKFFE